MRTPVLALILNTLAKPRSYRRRSGLFWKKHPELTTLIYLQRSRWGGGIYVNFGVHPSALVADKPPSVEHWGRSLRGESHDGPFREQFIALAKDDDDTMPAEDMTDAFLWLLDWLDAHFADADYVRQMVLQSPRHDEVLADGFRWCLSDWATGCLKTRSGSS